MSTTAPDIFISYASVDVEWVRALVRELDQHRYSVFWDRRIPTGQDWRTHIGAALAQARCVVVVWSKDSVSAKFVLEEADEGKEREVLVPVMRHKVRLPLGFRSFHAADLSEWVPGEASPAFSTFVDDLVGVLGSGPPRETKAPQVAEIDITTATAELGEDPTSIAIPPVQAADLAVPSEPPAKALANTPNGPTVSIESLPATNPPTGLTEEPVPTERDRWPKAGALPNECAPNAPLDTPAIPRPALRSIDPSPREVIESVPAIANAPELAESMPERSGPRRYERVATMVLLVGGIVSAGLYLVIPRSTEPPPVAVAPKSAETPLSETPASPKQPTKTADRDSDHVYWNKIRTSSDPADYHTYLILFPNGVYARNARDRIYDLQPRSAPPAQPEQPEQPAGDAGQTSEHSTWNSIRTSDDSSDFVAFLKRFPNGTYAAKARDRLYELRPRSTRWVPLTERSSAAPPAPAPAEPQTARPQSQSSVPTSAELPPAPPAAPAGPEPSATTLPLSSASRASAEEQTPMQTDRSPADVEAALGLSRGDWQAVQVELKTLGLDPGPPDGFAGAITRQALTEWQRRTGATATGYLAEGDVEELIIRGSYFTDDLVGGEDCSFCPEMVVVPAGTLIMGSPPRELERDDDEGPQRKVVFPRPFAIGRYEVTFAQWDACAAAGRCKGLRLGSGSGAEPLVDVSWDEAQAFVTWLSEKTGKLYRLPTEAEWEYAARAGTETPFWTGNTISTALANYDGKYVYGAGEKGVYRERTVEVNDPTFVANLFGLYHIHGNVWEWVQDCYRNSYEGASGTGSKATRFSNCPYRVRRGGSWYSDPWDLRSASRGFDAPDSRDKDLGFRVARTLAP